ncbi:MULTISPECIES: hypothetical protein [Gordonia]|uniref:hypothetical protein n=1 Tax=Gordonia TaxID=2053 RepID=UPI000780A550|nr:MULTISPECIES: hypothetical protein [Gordonia]WFN94169.1 hypothetical protein P5P27_06380 [Gordonia sihwensis]WFN94230.1 hypothetical protein P5P27_06690 [Gordonia sihwensis]
MRSSASTHEPRQFSAWSVCPGCGAVDAHGWELPPEVDTSIPAGQASHFEDTADVQVWAGQIARVNPIDLRYRVDQSTCEVVRCCRQCGEMWPEG